MTPCDRLPLIFEHGGLLSYESRQMRGKPPEPADAHFWGSANKKHDFRRHVVCGFMAPWWMCGRHDEELALILLGAAVCAKPGVCFCPGNSADGAFSAEEVLASIGPAAFDACFPNPDTYQAKSAEIFVPGEVPLIDFRGIVFCDAVARKHWWPELVAGYGRAVVKAPLPGPLGVFDKRNSDYRFTFPGV